MFGPDTAQSIEMSARLRRAEDEQWAANERLARSVRTDKPSWLARQVVGLLGRIRGTTSAETVAPTLAERTPITPAAVLSLRPVEAACEDELFDSSGSRLKAA